MKIAQYRIKRIDKDFDVREESLVWRNIPSLYIRNYFWAKTDYKPKVEVKLCYSAHCLYIFFKVYERKIRIQYTKFQDPVSRDSCVELFLDPFPDKKLGYINIETNAISAMLIEFGRERHNRHLIQKKDLRGFQIATSVKKPINGFHGSEFWTLKYRFPQKFFEKYYGEKIGPGQVAKGNFYKCGNETEFLHYGAWNPIQSPVPDFHRPEFFGKLIFE